MCSVYLYALTDRYDYGDSNLRKLTLNKSFAMDQTDDILNLCSECTKELYRKMEKCLLKLTTISSHLSFNEACLNNRLLPIFTIIYIFICIKFFILSQL